MLTDWKTLWVQATPANWPYNHDSIGKKGWAFLLPTVTPEDAKTHFPDHHSCKVHTTSMHASCSDSTWHIACKHFTLLECLPGRHFAVAVAVSAYIFVYSLLLLLSMQLMHIGGWAVCQTVIDSSDCQP